MNRVTLRIEGMSCAGCAMVLQALLERNAGVGNAMASFEQRAVRVPYDAAITSEEQLISAIERAGYRVIGCGAD
jgi:copper chaperone CopZ